MRSVNGGKQRQDLKVKAKELLALFKIEFGNMGLPVRFAKWIQFPLFGLGVGIGTNVGAKLLTGERAFLVAEGTFGATLGEFGPVLGHRCNCIKIHIGGNALPTGLQFMQDLVDPQRSSLEVAH